MSNDQAARNRVLDITKSFLVQAPAGSGKTSILVQRFLQTLANVQTAPEEIVAITFTRKAATEMRERILDALQLAAQSAAPIDAYKLSMWNLAKRVLERDANEGWQLLNNPARLKIQTIDALCTSIAKQMPILSRFGAQPQIESHPELLYERAVDQLLQALDHASAYPSNNGLFILLQHLDNDRLRVKKLLIRMLHIRAHWLPLIAQHNGAEDLRAFLERGLVLACEEALEDLNAIVPPVLDVAVMSHTEPQTLDEWLVVIDKLLTQDGTWRKTVSVEQGFHPPSKAKNKDEKQRLQAAKDAMLAMLERLRPHEEFRQQLLVLRELPPLAYDEQQWKIIKALCEVLPVLSAQLTLVFRDHGQVDFTEVSLAALNALQDDQAPSDLALALDCKIRHILVDEFQDTSNMQFKLLECLTANWDGYDGRTLFLVGDPMQSIYKFRHAEVGLFLKAKDYGIGNLQLEFVQLKVNFRSTANIIDWCNQVFSASFPSNDNKILGAITYMPAQAADAGSGQINGVSCLDVSDDAEAQTIIEIIQRCRQEDPDQTIAVLVRAKNHLVKILPALRAAKIDFQGVEIEGLNQDQQIQELLALTNALLHLDDRIAWLALLRAPWCALSLAELQIIADYEGTIFAAMQAPEVQACLSAQSQIRVQRFCNVMQDAILLLGRNKLAATVKNTIFTLGAHNFVRVATDGLACDTYYEFLHSIEHEPEIYRPGFIAQELAHVFAKPRNSDQNSVQIMTMHKAKGLEFDVVILPGLTKATRVQEQQLLLLEQREFEHEYLLFAPIRAAEQQNDRIYNYLAWCERQRTEHETLRQLYVAITRAKQKLYCLADLSDKIVGGMLGKIWEHVSQQFISYNTESQINKLPDRRIGRFPDDWFGEHNEYPGLKMFTRPRTLQAWQITPLSQAGTVMHRILCHIATIGVEHLPKNFLTTLAPTCTQQLRNIGMLQAEIPRAVNLVIQAVQNMLQDQFAQKILSLEHKESYAEWNLTNTVRLQPDLKFEQLRIDRVFVDYENNLWLIDYKLVTNAENLPDAIEKNKAQVLRYADILHTLKPDYKLIAGLYFPMQTHWEQLC